MNGIGRVPRSSIVIVLDEAICQRAAMMYNSDNGDVGPVLVIRIGSRYLVGKPDFRDDPDTYWLVQIHDEEWHLLNSCSHGS
jgi:hypothetical protein